MQIRGFVDFQYSANRSTRVYAPAQLDPSKHERRALDDHAFGFATVAGVVTVPLRRSPAFGSLNIRGSVQYGVLGTTTTAFNGGDRSFVVGSIGLALLSR